MEPGSVVDEKWLLDLERRHFVALAKTAKNQTEIDRLNSMADSLNDYMERQYQ